jgi:AcrR family transcriptional regulator
MCAARADAVRNRRALVTAAADAFAAHGLDVPLDDVARAAGLCNATMYRHFPTRATLVEAVFEDVLTRIIESAREYADEPDAWAAFEGNMSFLCELQASDRALADLLVAAVPAAPQVERLRTQALAGLSSLIASAHRQGVLRSDFGHQDVVLVLMANAGLLRRTREHAPDAWKRHLAFVLDGLRDTDADAAPELDGGIESSMAFWAGELRCTGE